MPGVRLAEAQLKHCANTYMYLFDWETSFFNLGACHALELAFVFGTHHHPALEPFFDGAKPGADELANAMQTAWCNFASSGSPGETASYADNRATLMFGSQIRAENDPYPAERELWNQLDAEIGKM